MNTNAFKNIEQPNLYFKWTETIGSKGHGHTFWLFDALPSTIHLRCFFFFTGFIVFKEVFF